MGNLMYKDSNIGGSTNYASAVACTDANGESSNVQVELDKMNQALFSEGGEGELSMNEKITEIYNKVILGENNLGFSTIDMVSATGGGVNMTKTYKAAEKCLILAVAQSSANAWVISTDGEIVMQNTGTYFGIAIVSLEIGQTVGFTKNGSSTWDGNTCFYKLT